MRPDFIITTHGGQQFKRSEMTEEQWRLFYTGEQWLIDGKTYRMLSDDVANLVVLFEKTRTTVRARTEWGRARLFCYNTGRIFLDADPKGSHWTGTVFGTVYLDKHILHKFAFTNDGQIPSVEEFTSVQPIV